MYHTGRTGVIHLLQIPTILLIAIVLPGCEKQSVLHQPLSLEPVTVESVPSPQTGPPLWYGGKQSLNSQTIIGYGSGESEQIATTHALEEIASQIRTHIRSEINLNSSSQGGVGHRYFEQQIQQQTDLELQQTEPLRREQKQGVWYVSMRYQNLTLAEKIRRNSPKACSDLSTHPYLTVTPMMREIEATLGCQPAVGLLEKHGQWNLQVGAVLYPLTDRDFQKLFTPVETHGLRLAGVQSLLRQGTLFFSEIESDQDGIINYLQVDQNGVVTIMVENQRIVAGESLQFPDPELYDGLEATLPARVSEVRDLHLLLRCSEVKDWTRFEQVRSTLPTQSPRFGQLLPEMEGCAVSGVMMRVVP